MWAMRNFCAVSAAAVLTIAMTMMSGNLWAGNLSFLSDEATSYFDEEDVAMMSKAVREAVESADAKAKRRWNNPDTGNSGSVAVLRMFLTADGIECKRVRIENSAKDRNKSVANHTLCNRTAAGWQLDSAKPAT